MMKLDKENKLTNEALEQVAGGNAGECALESEFFNDLGYNIPVMGFLDMEFNWEEGSAKVKEGWAHFGVDCHIAKSVKNEYYINGKRVSRREAFKHAAYKAGKPWVYDDDYSKCAL